MDYYFPKLDKLIIFLNLWKSKYEMQTIENLNELLTVQKKINRYQKVLQKTSNNLQLEEIHQLFEYINKKINETIFLISQEKVAKAHNKIVELVKIILLLSKKLKKIEKIEIAESIISDSINGLLKYALNTKKKRR